MINNPFATLDIEPTINEAIITQAYEVLKQKGGTAEHLKHLDAAFQECLFFARSEGGIEAFTHKDLNQDS
ncbi:MAG: hypothetical protein EOP49_08790 [Sphingobacteriales bacterium]|nr:MAG: hypothetical protein EOP49_08790 [Sphingobacteriales bacterium]